MLLQNRYDYEPTTDWLADGSASRIYKATDIQQQKPVVLKFYHHLGNLTPIAFKANMQKAATLSHDNLVQLYDYFEIENINPLGQLDYIRIGVWEYVERAEAQADATESLLRQANNAIRYLQEQNNSHGSLEIDNVFVTADQQVKLNNASIFRNEYSTTMQDVVALSHILRQHLANENDELKDNTREVYRVIIDRAATDQLNDPKDIDNLLDTYERNKRFDSVLPFSKEQFESRYNLQGIIDSSDEHTTYQATDNLSDESLQLVVYHETPSAKLYNSLQQHARGSWFKVDFGDKLCLVATQSETAQQDAPLAQTTEELAHTATVPTAALAALAFDEVDTTADVLPEDKDTATFVEDTAETDRASATQGEMVEEELIADEMPAAADMSADSNEATAEAVDANFRNEETIAETSETATVTEVLVDVADSVADDVPDMVEEQATAVADETEAEMDATLLQEIKASDFMDEDLKSTEVVRNEAIAQVLQEENELDDLIKDFERRKLEDAEEAATENLKSTEIIRGEAMEQVQRDIERMLANKKDLSE